jgi:hypothetical protein
MQSTKAYIWEKPWAPPCCIYSSLIAVLGLRRHSLVSLPDVGEAVRISRYVGNHEQQTCWLPEIDSVKHNRSVTQSPLVGHQIMLVC